MAEENIADYTNNIVTESSFDFKTPNEIFNKFNEAVGLIKTDSGFFGSGFVISSDGLIVTNQHVIDGAEKIVAGFIIDDEIQIFDVKKIVNKREPPIDIAILKVEADSLPSVPLGDPDFLSVGDPIYAIGNPEGYRNTISDGILSQRRSFNNVEHLQITASISGGSSGGPVINEFGEVVGVATLYHRVGQNLNFAVPVNYVKDLLSIEEDAFFEFSDWSEEMREDYIKTCVEFGDTRENCLCEYEYLINNYGEEGLFDMLIDHPDREADYEDAYYEAILECF